MQTILEAPLEKLAAVRAVFSDIDDTLSSEGKITAEAYAALWRLHDAGLKVVPVTGRPAGWCDMIARFWPVDGVIGENGGLYFYHTGEKLERRFLYSDAERAQFRARLENVRERILAEVPGAAVAADQPYREYDLAIDFCEDVAPLQRSQITRIREIFEEEGAHAKISSIHVNGWYGDFDKLSMARIYARDRWNVDLDAANDHYLFCGDSPNDEPMFAYFNLSVGMANLLDFIELVEHQPAYITTHRAGEGFVEVCDRLLHARATFPEAPPK